MLAAMRSHTRIISEVVDVKTILEKDLGQLETRLAADIKGMAATEKRRENAQFDNAVVVSKSAMSNQSPVRRACSPHVCVDRISSVLCRLNRMYELSHSRWAHHRK